MPTKKRWMISASENFGSASDQNAFLCADSLIAGLSAEIFPTAYRATVSGLRYVVGILSGAVALVLEGPLYDLFHAHGPALIALMAAMPIAMIAILRLPEPAGRTLEDIASEPDRKQA